MVDGMQVGAYRILKQIGEGGMGSVWLAEHTALGRRAALKVLHPEFSHRPDIVTRFFNEARAATAIADPGIVQIFDFGRHVDGRAYIVMELLQGEPLDVRLKRQGAFDLIEGLRLMRQVASTLGAAHACGIVHRDLKPENIYIVRDPEVPGGERAKVLDFGIAKLVGEQGGVKTQTAALMGTPAFMSPEQCRGAGQVDQRSDVYALGCVLFTLVAGRPPFLADGAGDIIAMQLREPPPAPSQLRPGIPREVDQLVLRCLDKDPARRFPTAGELAIAIGALIASSPQVPSVEASGYPPGRAPTTLSSATGAHTAPPARRSRRGWIAATVGLAAAGAVVAILAATRSERAIAPVPAPRAATPPTAGADREPTPAPTESGANRGASPTPASPAPDAERTAVTTPEAVPPGSTASRAMTPPSALDARTAASIKDALARFTAWSHDHPRAACPDAVVLGAAADPWGHPLTITCTEQPADQIAGAISVGPDGKLGTDDDIASWRLGRDVTDIVRGARWGAGSSAPAASRRSEPRLAPAPGKPAEKSTHTVELDANGMPITR